MIGTTGWTTARRRRKWPSNGPSPDIYTDDDAETAYGWSDLSQYGTWSDVPGEGYGWTPSVVAERLGALLNGPVVLVSRLGLHLDWRRTVGMVALSLWRVGFHSGKGLGMVPGQPQDVVPRPGHVVSRPELGRVDSPPAPQGRRPPAAIIAAAGS